MDLAPIASILAAVLTFWPSAIAAAGAGIQPDAIDRRFTTVAAAGKRTVRLYSEERGQGASTIVLLHGLGETTYAWRRVAPKLAATHRVIALDLKGFGRSSKPSDGRYSITDQALLVRQFLSDRGLSHVTLIGHSLGGAVALAAALTPLRGRAEDEARGGGGSGADPIERLVLIAAPAYAQKAPAMMALLKNNGLGEALLEVTPADMIAKMTLSSASHKPDGITAGEIAAYAAPLREPGARQALLATVRALEPGRFAYLISRYPTLTVPALLLWCHDDRIVPASIGYRLSRSLPRAKLKLLEGCNHRPAEEKPAATLKAIEAFLAE